MFPAEAIAMKLWKSKTRDYHQTLNEQVASGIAERFKTQDLRKWGHFKAVFLSFHWLNDSGTRGFELITRGFELITRGFKLVTRGFELVTRKVELVTRGFQLVHSFI